MATDRVDLNDVQDRFRDELHFPVDRDEAAGAFADTTVVFSGGGEENLGDLISQIGADAFESADDLYTELQNVLPVEAVGEPGQSEGEG